MNTYTELRERRHALLFTIEHGCRRQGIRQWDDIRRYLLAVTNTPQGRHLLLDATEVEGYIQQRRDRIARKHQSRADRTAERLLTARDRQLADAFTRMVDSMPATGGLS